MKQDSAVSPVVGVMLMLVVTITVAAVVAAFVGGITSDEQIAPSVNFDVSYVAGISDTDKTNSVPDYSSSASKNNGFVFKLLGGDPVQLDKIKIMLTSDGSSITFDPSIYRDRTSPAVNEAVIDIMFGIDNTTSQTYYAVPNNLDTTIAVGESFILLADGYYDNTADASASKIGRFLLWTPETGGRFVVQEHVPVTYTIFDITTGKQIQKGTITIN
ncbi:MAG: type IV pilin [Methanocorpusculum sp.]|nr:type IV pilin [Methanocorpusculum sp.]